MCEFSLPEPDVSTNNNTFPNFYVIDVENKELYLEDVFDKSTTVLNDDKNLFKETSFGFIPIKSLYKRLRPFLITIRYLTEYKEMFLPEDKEIDLVFSLYNTKYNYYHLLFDMFPFINNIILMSNNNLFVKYHERILTNKYSKISPDMVKKNKEQILIFEFQNICLESMLEIQMDIFEAINPVASLMNFRLPYSSRTSEKEINYYNGKLVLEPFSSLNSNECKLFWFKTLHGYDKRAYDIQNYDSNHKYLDLLLRKCKLWKYKSDDKNTYDICYSKLIIDEYNKIFNSDITLDKLNDIVKNFTYIAPHKRK